MENYTLYTKTICPRCKGLQRYADKEGLVFNEVNIDHDENALEMLKDLGIGSVPVVLDQNKEVVIQGFDIPAIKRLKQEVAMPA